MILAAYRDDAYDVVLLLHVLSFLVGFAPAVINPFLARHLEHNADEAGRRAWYSFAVLYTQRFALPALVVLLLTGTALVAMSDDVIEMSDAWISAAFLVWLAIGGVVSAVILKGEKAVAAGEFDKEKLVQTGGKIASALTVVMLYLMIFKPGM